MTTRVPWLISSLAALYALSGFWASARQERSTIREAVLKAGFAEAANAAGVRDLDEPLTSSDFGVAGDTFAAGYYLVREMDRQGLGPLHVTLYRRRVGRWLHASNYEDRGSVMAVQVTPERLLLDLHRTPSAGTGLVLDVLTLRLVASLRGYDLRPLQGGDIVFKANMVHFAPTSQERLMMYEGATHRETEVFPGPIESPLATAYRQTVVSTYSGLPSDQKKELASSPYGPVDDFDRSVSRLTAGGPRRLAFVVAYYSARLGDFPPRLWTIVRCDGVEAGWSCNERPLDEAAAVNGVALTFDDRRLPVDYAAIDRILQALLAR
jgi:hypothetical protein